MRRSPKIENNANNKNARSMRYAVSAIVLILLVAVNSLLFTGCSVESESKVTDIERPVVTGVTIVDLQPSPVDESYETSGIVKAKTTAIIASRIMGTVTSLKATEGDRVQAGQVLLMIDDRDVAQRVKAAEKGVEAARLNKSLTDITYQRYKKLVDEDLIPQQEMDRIETQKGIADSEYERAKAVFSEAMVYQGFTKVTAPVSGIITEKKIDEGSMAVPGMHLLTIDDISSFRIEANVDESLFTRLKIGMPVNVIIESLAQEIKGTISEIVPSIDPLSRTFLIKADIKGKGLKGGLYAKMKVPFAKKEALLIPKTGIVERGQLTGVYAIDEKGIVAYRLVRVGKAYDNQVEVLSGIGAGDRIVVDGIQKVVEGGVVR